MGKATSGIQNGNTSSDVLLRDVVESDLVTFFEHHKDPNANNIAAFTAKNPTDHSAFLAHWKRILGNDEILIQTIIFHGNVAGHVLNYVQFGEREVSYWIGKEYWGKGIASEALSQYLAQVQFRPLFARAAKDNIGSVRVLEKCGFRVIGDDKGYSNARGVEVEEFIFQLEG